jgi:hydroxymethylpyrimidine pyrophosphatase-like HAD family hydrolase
MTRTASIAPVRLAVVDVDGCLTPGEARDWDWEALRAIQELNRRARWGEAVPAVTLCTGRQEPYVEALMQAIGAFLPGIYENGCGLYFPDTYRFVEHSAITGATRQALAKVKAVLACRVLAPGLGYLQPGKEVSLSLYPLPGTTVAGLEQTVSNALAGYENLLTVQASVSCVDVIPRGLDKGAGVSWLSRETGIPLVEMGGIGDSTSDLKFLRLVGRSASPANAVTEVQSEVDYVSVYEDGQGVVDILHRWSIEDGDRWPLEEGPQTDEGKAG